MAIDLRMKFAARPRDDDLLVVDMPDIDKKLTISPHEEIRYEEKRDYLRSVVNVLKRRGVKFGGGHDITITSGIPINSGCSSSSALVIGLAKLLLELNDDPLKDDLVEIAKIGHAAEVLEFKEPGGMMDHYTCSLGGLLYIDCADPVAVERLDADISGVVVCDSLEQKDTTGVLGMLKKGVRDGVKLLREIDPDFSLKTSALKDALPHLEKIPESERSMVYATLRNRDITREARKRIVAGDLDAIGRLLDAHHAILRGELRISTPKIESMIAAAKNAGAQGCKINGSGLGGTMIAYAPGSEEQVADAVRKLDADVHIVKMAEGVRVENS
jgi:galactokinase